MMKATCVIVGGGPAGMVLGLLLARAGVETTVLEKHGDFMRDFRGDTVHASTLTLLDELGLGAEFAALPQRTLTDVALQLGDELVRFADLRGIPGPHKRIALVPQWDLLDLLATAGRREPEFRLLLDTEATGLLRTGRRVPGVRYRRSDGTSGELRADLIVACDGRHSALRAAAGLVPRSFPGVPFDVWWLRLPRREGDPGGLLARFARGGVAVLIDRHEYWQCALLIAKGSDPARRAAGLPELHDTLAGLVPWLGPRARAITSWDEVQLLDVRLERLRRWWRPGLLCLGDAAHAMSPVGGVGINLAIQDAVAAARILAPALRRGRMGGLTLARVQLRRWLPTALTQAAQRLLHRSLVRPSLAGHSPVETGLPWPLRLLRRFPVLQRVPAAAVAIGVLPEHAPAFARRPPTADHPVSGR